MSGVGSGPQSGKGAGGAGGGGVPGQKSAHNTFTASVMVMVGSKVVTVGEMVALPSGSITSPGRNSLWALAGCGW